MPTAKTQSARRAPRLSRQRPPPGLSVEQWQAGLRRQFGREQDFAVENLGRHPFFSDFEVRNAEARTRYRVTIRGLDPALNDCTCPDHATNALGTCKHIEFVLERLSRRRGARTAFARGHQPAYSELRLSTVGPRTLQFRPGAECPGPLRRAAARLFDEQGGWRLGDEGLDALEGFIAQAQRAGHELRVREDVRGDVAGRRDALDRRARLETLFPGGAGDRRLARLLETRLYPYQAQGILFAVRAGRALIADEMGLGKTVQAIGAMELLARHFGVSRVLVVCPVSLKFQWQSEIRRFCGRDARVVTGLQPLRQQAYAADDFCKITNYETLRADLDLIAAWSPDLVIVDEAQRIKNWNTIAARALKRIDSPYALVLTGTPVENRLEELVSIVQFVDQHRLGPTWKLQHEHQLSDDHGRVIGYTGLERIGQALEPIMIRRRKAEVLTQLPSRTDQDLLVPMTLQQRAHHDENAGIVARIVERWKRMGFLTEKDQLRMTCALQAMRMACNSTWLLDRETDHGFKADELMSLLDGWLPDPDVKVVVFSQWVGTQDIVVRRLEARGIAATWASTAACRPSVGASASSASGRTRSAASSCRPTPAAPG